MYYIKKSSLAREFRKNPTSSENILWQAIRKRKIYGFKFLRQYVIAGFILDFYCSKLKLGIEVDGKIHNLKDNNDYDLKRENIIKQYNIKIIRFTNEDIENDILTVLKNLKDYINNMK